MRNDFRYACALALLLAFGCKSEGEAPGPSVGSNSNWLVSCGAPVDCSAPELPECACGVCTIECTTDDDCAMLEDARCAPEAHAAARSLCAASAMSTGICLPRCEPGACGDGQACVNGACVTSHVEGPFCGEAVPDEAARVLEDQLLALANARRAAGDLACPGAADSMPQPELRFDPRLSCAARALAIDMETSRELGITDSMGRDTQARAELAGYGATLWYEAYALEATTAEMALTLMLGDAGACAALADAQYLDVGLGNSGDAFTLIVARD